MKKTYIIIGIILLLLVIAIAGFIYLRQPKALEPAAQPAVFTPDFLSAQEKRQLGMPEEARIQAVQRATNGEVLVYKIIRNDNQVVDPKTVKSISPRQ